MLTLNSLMFGSENPKNLAEFYEKVLGRKPDMVDGDWYRFSTGACFLSIGSHDKVKGKVTNPERIILNFETIDVKAEFDRIKSLGAAVIVAPYTMGDDNHQAMIATADPDGNYFQLTTSWEA